MKCKKADVWKVAGRAFPSYKGRSFAIEAAERVTLHDLNWGGGTRNQYVAVELAGERVNAPEVPAPWRHQAEGQTLDIPEGWAVVEHSIFCGVDMGLRVYVNPKNLAALLPAPQEVR